MESAPGYEVSFGNLSMTPFVRGAPWPGMLLFMIVVPIMTDRLADSVIGGPGARLVCDALVVALLWRFYVSFVARLVLSDTTLDLTCTKDAITYALDDITAMRVFSFGASGYTVIHVKTRTSWMSRRFRCLPRQNVLTFEQTLIDACRARGINARSSTIVLWR